MNNRVTQDNSQNTDANLQQTITGTPANQGNLQQVLAASAYNGTAAVPRPGTAGMPRNPVGLFERLIGGKLARDHWTAMMQIRNSAIEGQAGLTAVGVIVNDLVENGLETEEGMEQSILRHSQSQLASATAPIYAQLGRAIGMQASENIALSTTKRIQRQIER